jgi:hypothetical protein
MYSNKANSLSSSPRKSIKPVSNYIYNLHQMEYDYSIITKDSQRLLNHKRPIKVANKINLHHNRLLKNNNVLPKLKYTNKHKKSIPNLNMYSKNPHMRYKSTGKRMAEMKKKMLSPGLDDSEL